MNFALNRAPDKTSPIASLSYLSAFYLTRLTFTTHVHDNLTYFIINSIVSFMFTTHYSPFIVFATLAIAAPAMAAPVFIGNCGRAFSFKPSDEGCPSLLGPLIRGLADIPKREVSDSVGESGAFSLEDAAHLASIGSSIISAGESLFGG